MQAQIIAFPVQPMRRVMPLPHPDDDTLTSLMKKCGCMDCQKFFDDVRAGLYGDLPEHLK